VDNTGTVDALEFIAGVIHILNPAITNNVFEASFKRLDRWALFRLHFWFCRRRHESMLLVYVIVVCQDPTKGASALGVSVRSHGDKLIGALQCCRL
jgi:hypothetical protein